MIKKIFGFTIPAIIIVVIGIYSLENKIQIGPILLLLGILPVLTLLIFRKSIKSAIPDIIFGSIDTGLLTIPAIIGGSFYGVVGAITGGLIGDALTDGIAGFFEGSIAEFLRKKGINESREALVTSLGKMSGCLIGSGIILTIAIIVGVNINKIQ